MSTNLMKRLIEEDDAGEAVEYGLITALIAIGLIAALIAFRDRLGGWFTDLGDSITGAS